MGAASSERDIVDTNGLTVDGGPIPTWWWAALSVMAGELVTLVAGPIFEVGFVGISWTILAMPLLIVTTRGWWLARGRIARVNLVLMGAAVCAATWFVGVLSDPGSASAIFVAATTEELAYRVAGPVLVAGVMSAVGMRHGPSLAVGVCASSVLFTLLPGHTMQAESIVALVPFVAFSALYSLVVWRTRNLFGAVLTHAAVNLFTFPVQLAAQPAVHDSLMMVRAACVGIVTVLFVGGSYWARYSDDADTALVDRTEPDPDDREVIDLREPVSEQGTLVAPLL